MANQTAKIIEHTYYKDTGFYRISYWHFESEQYNEALKLSESIEDAYYKASILTWIAGKES